MREYLDEMDQQYGPLSEEEIEEGRSWFRHGSAMAEPKRASTGARYGHLDMSDTSRIVVDREVLTGKPAVRGARVPVELVLRHLAENPDPVEVMAAFPRLTLDDVKACIAYAQALVEGEDVFPLEPATTA